MGLRPLKVQRKRADRGDYLTRVRVLEAAPGAATSLHRRHRWSGGCSELLHLDGVQAPQVDGENLIVLLLIALLVLLLARLPMLAHGQGLRLRR